MQHVDDAIPLSLHDFFASFFQEVESKGFPPVFRGLGAPPVRSVPPPDPAVLNSPAVRRDRASIVKVQGTTHCRTNLEGSAFLFAPDHVMTNAHVVAGVTSLRVLTDGGASFPGRVVLYDPNRDVAVIYVPGISAATLAFAGPAADGASAVVAGYPENGPFTADAARVRNTEETTGPNIYQRGDYRRQIYAIRGVVRPGNSGGPLLATDGRVYGVVFAAATDSSDTGYVLTAAEVASDARAGSDATRPVSTESCR
jgi:S1-C subfamily serine protease